jgi:protease-4
MNKKTIGCLSLFFALILIASVAGNFILAAMLTAKSKVGHPSSTSATYAEELTEGTYGSDRKIVVIELFGLISYSVPGMVGNSMVNDVIAQLHQARQDDDVAAIIIHMDSPGGEVTASDWLYHEVKKCNETKPVLVYMDSVAASGAYYTAMGASHIVANELCITASIGVILQTINYEKLSELIGIRTLTFKSGEMKDLLNPARPMSDTERAYVQSLIDETYNKFVGIVASRRKLDEAGLRGEMADGRIVSGKTAQQAGLVDSIGYMEDAVAKAREIAKLGEDSPVVRYIAPFSFSQLFRLFGESAAARQTTVRVQLGPETMPLEAGKLYYLSPHLFHRAP